MHDRSGESSSACLTIDHLRLTFGGVTAVDDVSFELADGGICGLIGPNGAGKTSLLNCVSGFYRPTEGEITLDGASVLAMRRHQLIGRGMARTFQNLALFSEMTVFDNVAVGASRGRGRTRSRSARRAQVWELLDRFDLVGVAGHKAHGLPFGTLKRVEFARALMSNPRLLLLDEPAGGLTHTEVDDLGALITSIAQDFGPTIVLVEHHMGLILSVCDRIVVLDSGRVIADGAVDVVRNDPAVINAYLGGGHDLAAH